MRYDKGLLIIYFKQVCIFKKELIQAKMGRKEKKWRGAKIAA